MVMSKTNIGLEFARRKKQFHNDENWKDIRLWGLFNWGDISRLIKTGEIITSYCKEHRVACFQPSEEFYKKWVAPYIDSYNTSGYQEIKNKEDK